MWHNCDDVATHRGFMMSTEQGNAPPSLPTPSEVKEGIAGNARLTSSTLDFIRSRLIEHERLRTRLLHIVDEVSDLASPRSLWQAIKETLCGERPSQEKARGVLLSGRTVEQEADSIRSTLRSAGYGEIEDRSQEHYDDIKRLTLLEISGDPEANVLHQRSTDAIFRLRIAQREVENLPPVSREMSALEENISAVCDSM